MTKNNNERAVGLELHVQSAGKKISFGIHAVVMESPRTQHTTDKQKRDEAYFASVETKQKNVKCARAQKGSGASFGKGQG